MDNANTVILMINLAEYGFTLYEDESTNRMNESMLLTEELANSAHLHDVPIFIVFNMTDYFVKELRRGKSPSLIFNDYGK